MPSSAPAKKATPAKKAPAKRATPRKATAPKVGADTTVDTPDLGTETVAGDVPSSPVIETTTNVLHILGDDNLFRMVGAESKVK